MLSITDIFSPKLKGILTVVRFKHRRTLGLATEHKRPFFRHCQRDGSCFQSSALATTQKLHENTQKLRPNTQKLPYYSESYNYLDITTTYTGFTIEHKRPFFRHCQSDRCCFQSSALAIRKNCMKTRKNCVQTHKNCHIIVNPTITWTLRARIQSSPAVIVRFDFYCPFIFRLYYKNLTEGYFFRCRFVGLWQYGT